MKNAVKRTSLIILTFAILMSIMTTNTFAGKAMTFSDVRASDWFKPYIDTMSEKGICVGYGNGKYGPRDNLQIDQLIKLVVVAMGYSPQATGSYWATGYINKAKELGLVKEGEFTDYTRKITRGEIARIIARGMKETFPSDLDSYKNLIKDYSSIKTVDQEYVLKVYSKGIVNGYTDGRFGASDYATRGEASKMIICMIDPGARGKVATVSPSPAPEVKPSPIPGTGAASKYDAIPDAEFEAFMRSAEAEKYIYTDAIAEVNDGKIYFNTISIPKSDPHYSKKILPPDDFNPYINKEVYETVRNLMKLVRKYGGFIVADYTPADSYRTVMIEYYNTKKFWDFNMHSGWGFFSVVINAQKDHIEFYPGKQKEPITYIWSTGKLCTDAFLDKQGYGNEWVKTKGNLDKTKYDFTEDRFEEMVLDMLMSIYGRQQGQNLMTYVMKEQQCWETVKNYSNEIFEYKPEFGGCQFMLDIDDGAFIFCTSGVKEKK